MLAKIAGLLILAISLGGQAAAAGWSSYTNSDEVRQIAVRGDLVWAATSGGAVAVNTTSGDITKLTNIDGLAGIDLRSIDVDTSGNIWFGSGDGWLIRRSGAGIIRNYAIRDSAGLIGSAVTLFDLENDGANLWLASNLGVSKFLLYSNDGEIRDTARRLGNLPIEEDAVCVDVIAGNLWVGTARGIAFTNRDNPNIQYFGNWRSFSAGENGLAVADIKTITAYHDTVLAGTANGVYKLQVAPETLWVSIGLEGASVNKLYMSPSGLLAATSTGLYSYDGSQWQPFTSTGLPQGLASDLIAYPAGDLWAGTPSSGLAKLTADQWSLYSIPGPASNIISEVALDSSDGIWMAHNSRGLSRFSGGWSIFNASNSDPDGAGPLQGLFDNDQVSLTIAPDGDLWTGSFGGGLYHYDGASWYRWNADNSPMYGVRGAPNFWAATAVHADPGGNIWVSAFDADSSLLMGVYNPQNPDPDLAWQLYKGNTIGISVGFVKAIRSQGEYIWVGRGDGFDRLNTGGTPFDIGDDNWQTNIGRLDVVDMDIDPMGDIWLATTLGLYAVIDTPVNIELPTEISGSVTSVASDGVGNIWVGTVAGLGVLKPDRIRPEFSRWQTTYTVSNSPLLNNKVNDVAIELSSGMVYIGTDGGLSIFDSGILPPSPDLADMDAFPNPVVLSSGVQFVEFKKVPSNGTLTIYTASGDKVARFDLAQTSTWDLKNSEGKRVAGGIYFFHVRSGDASGTGKIAVIR